MNMDIKTKFDTGEKLFWENQTFDKNIFLVLIEITGLESIYFDGDDKVSSISYNVVELATGHKRVLNEVCLSSKEDYFAKYSM